MKNFKKFFIIVIICILTLLALLSLVLFRDSIFFHSSFGTSEMTVKEKDFSSMTTVAEVFLDNNSIVGTFKSLNTDEEGIYLLSKNKLCQVQISYSSLTASNKDETIVYNSTYSSEVYNVYSLNDGILLLEMYYDDSKKLSFCLTRIGKSVSYDNIYQVYQDTCDRMPYVKIADLVIDSDSDEMSSEILLNYDNNGISSLILLSSYYGDGKEPTIINSANYKYHEDSAIESGRRIVFCGGYGKYVYYQALYNSILDPSPEVATFEAVGSSVLFCYNIFTEEIIRVGKLDKKVLHVNGSQDYTILSEYDYDMPLTDSGKVLSIGENGKEYSIPGVESGTDICSSKFIEEGKVIFYTSKTLYFADLDRCVLYTYDLSENTLVLLEQYGVYIVENNDNQAKIQYISYEESFENYKKGIDRA